MFRREHNTKQGLQINVGGVYVGAGDMDYVMRLVTGEGPEPSTISWESYNTRTGEATRDSGCCSMEHLSRWAGRQATAIEIARMHKAEPTYDQEQFQSVIDVVRRHERKKPPEEHFKYIAQYMQAHGTAHHTLTVEIGESVYTFEAKRIKRAEQEAS